jgi:hypothetical protein
LSVAAEGEVGGEDVQVQRVWLEVLDCGLGAPDGALCRSQTLAALLCSVAASSAYAWLRSSVSSMAAVSPISWSVSGSQ